MSPIDADGKPSGTAVKTWSDEEWARLPEEERPAGAIRFGFGWIKVVKGPSTRPGPQPEPDTSADHADVEAGDDWPGRYDSQGMVRTPSGAEIGGIAPPAAGPPGAHGRNDHPGDPEAPSD